MSMIISFSDRQKRITADRVAPYTGAWLKAQARRHCLNPGKQLSRKEFLGNLPGLLDEVLELGMQGIDYGPMKETDIAQALRCLALVAVSLEKVMSTTGESSEEAACGSAPCAIDESSLKATIVTSGMLRERRSALFSAIRGVQMATAQLNETYGAIHDAMMDLPLHVDNILTGK